MTEVNEVNVSQRGNMGEGEGGGKGGLVKIIIIAVVALVLLGGGTVGALLFFGSDDEAEMGGDAPSEAAAVMASKGGCPTEQLDYIELGTFVVNLADGRRYLKTNIEMMLCDEEVQLVKAYLEKRSAEMKDLVVSELQTLSTEQLRDQRERELLRQRLLRRIESLLPNKEREWSDPNLIKKILITEFYLQ